MNMNELKSPPESSTPELKERKRQQVQQELQREKEMSTSQVGRMRLIPIWLRLIVIALLLIAAAAAGILTGYSGIGNGEAGDALKWDTWQHLLDIIEGKE